MDFMDVAFLDLTSYDVPDLEAGQESPFRRLGMDRNRNNALSKNWNWNWGGDDPTDDCDWWVRHVLVRVRVTIRVTVRARGGAGGWVSVPPP